VTLTVSDPAAASIEPCITSTVGGISTQPPPPIIPQVGSVAPCAIPTSTVPGQALTWVNGQASALLLPSPSAHPETITVLASLGVYIPPMYACLVAPYLPQNSQFGTLTGILVGGVGAPLLPSTGAPGTAGCGTGSAIGFTGTASALSTNT